MPTNYSGDGSNNSGASACGELMAQTIVSASGGGGGSRGGGSGGGGSGGGGSGGGSGGGGSGGGGSGGGSAPVPVLSALSVSPRTFALSGRLVKGACVPASAANSHARHRTRQVKLQVSYRLSTAAILTFTLARTTSGRLFKGHCMKPTAANRRARSCTLLVGVGGALHVSGRQTRAASPWAGALAGISSAPAATG